MTSTGINPTLKEQRAVRVFVSSTFLDMQEEREELVKFIFPELTRRCRERKVEFIGVDLRWGITDEQTAEGKVLPICLAEIEGCRPYFIGLLGERYGWVPKEIDDDLMDKEPWLKEHGEKSVTELEILHGVLNNPEMKGLAFFYFRDKNRSDAIEHGLSQEPGYVPEPDAASKIKLNTLKQKIEKSGCPVKKNFKDSKTLGQWVLEDLWSAIDKRFPKEEVPTELEQKRIENEAFAEARRKVYVGGKKYFDKLDKHTLGEGPPLIILGESGAGKSALLANWAEKYRQKYPEDFMVCHYIGSTTDSGDYIQMLRRIMEEIQEKYEPLTKKEEGISQISREESSIPTDPQKVVEAFSLWLGRAASRGRFILILDALNQLEDRDNAPDLGWLPWSFSTNVRLIVSTLPGRSLDALKKRNWPEMTVGLMDKADQERYIIDYLKQYRKELNPAQKKKIIKEELAANPLYLRTILEELRIFGKYHELDKEIEHYLQAETIDGLFNLVLERLERDYERERKGLVKDLTTLIWASRKGLSETEILEFLETEDSPMPRAIFSPLYLALEESLVSRSGLLTFFHHFLRKAVEERYIPNTDDKQKAHLNIADYFDKKTLDDRKVDELPWQLCQGESWDRLKNCITDMDIFLKLNTDTKRYELTGYWLSMADRFDMVEGYNAMIARYESTSPDPLELAYCLHQTAFFLKINARYKGAEPLYRRALQIEEKFFGPEHPDIALSLNNLAALLFDIGHFQDAEPLYNRSLAIYQKVLGPDHPRTAAALNNIAEWLCNKGKYEDAESLHRRALEIREKVLGPEHLDTVLSLNNLAALLFAKGNYQDAEPLYNRALAIKEKVLGPEHPDTALSLNNLAVLLYSKRDYEGAEPLYHRALEIDEKVLGTEHPRTAFSLNNLAALLFAKGDYQDAEPLYRRALEIEMKVLGPEHPDTALNLINLAALLYAKHDYKAGETLYLRALSIYEKAFGPDHPDTISLSKDLLNLALSFRNIRDDQRASSLFQHLIEILEDNKASNPNTIILLATCHNELAFHMEVPAKNWKEAEYHYKKAIELFNKILVV